MFGLPGLYRFLLYLLGQIISSLIGFCLSKCGIVIPARDGNTENPEIVGNTEIQTISGHVDELLTQEQQNLIDFNASDEAQLIVI